MRYVILGDNNGLGLTVIKEIEFRGYEEICYLDDSEVKSMSKKKLENYIKLQKPDVIIDLVEDNNIVRAELSDYTELDCYKTNVHLTKEIVDIAKDLDCKLIYLSSDAVYPGTKEGFYKETDHLDSPSVYGATKITAESEVRKHPKHFIVRPGYIYGGRHDIIDDLLWTEERVIPASLEVVSPTNMDFLASTIADMAHYENYGTYNVADSGRCTIKEFAESVRNIYRRNFLVEGIDQLDYYVAPNRALNTDKLVENGYQKPSFWVSSLVAFCKSHSPSNDKVLKLEK